MQPYPQQYPPWNPPQWPQQGPWHYPDPYQKPPGALSQWPGLPAPPVAPWLRPALGEADPRVGPYFPYKPGSLGQYAPYGSGPAYGSGAPYAGPYAGPYQNQQAPPFYPSEAWAPFWEKWGAGSQQPAPATPPPQPQTTEKKDEGTAGGWALFAAIIGLAAFTLGKLA